MAWPIQPIVMKLCPTATDSSWASCGFPVAGADFQTSQSLPVGQTVEFVKELVARYGDPGHEIQMVFFFLTLW
jgi:hypothetical protein